MSRKIDDGAELECIVLNLREHHHIMWAINTTVSERRRTIMYSGCQEEFDNINYLTKSLRKELHRVYKPDVELIKMYDSMYINKMRHKFKYFKHRFISKLDNKKY